MKILRWIAGCLGALVLLVLLLDTFGGYVLEGPLGPIPGGALEGPVSIDPDWAEIEEVIELEIRPDRPWSLSIWAVVIDGELYVPSGFGERRRWPSVALEDPRVRVRTRGKIYERRIVRITENPLRERVARAVAKRYGLNEKETPGDDSTWIFHLAARSQ